MRLLMAEVMDLIAEIMRKGASKRYSMFLSVDKLGGKIFPLRPPRLIPLPSAPVHLKRPRLFQTGRKAA